MINLKNIQYKISQKIILQNIDLNIQEGKTTVIMGKNGSGKSTLLKLLNQIYLIFCLQQTALEIHHNIRNKMVYRQYPFQHKNNF